MRRIDQFLTRAGGIGLLVALAAPLAPAFAGGLPPPTLPGATSYEYVGLNFLENVQTSQSVGTLNYTGDPGCGGTCTATTTLNGPLGGPAVSVNIDQVVYDGTGGGYSAAELNYYVEYVNGPTGTMFPVTINASDALSVVGLGDAQAFLGFGIASSPAPTSLNAIGGDFASSNTFTDTDCASGSAYSKSDACQLGEGNYTSPLPLASTNVEMESGVPYDMTIWVDLGAGTEGVPESATLDPTFTDNGQGGTFYFSDGVSNGSEVPEPTSAMALLAGLGALAAMRRARAR
jgi:hypothetical protein